MGKVLESEKPKRVRTLLLVQHCPWSVLTVDKYIDTEQNLKLFFYLIVGFIPEPANQE